MRSWGSSGVAYNPSFDVLRVLAVALVLAGHGATLKIFSGGAFGVDLFFVLSGYLITSILMREHQTFGAISLQRFYLRRLRRLTPALFVLLGVYVVMVVALKGADMKLLVDAGMAAIYMSSYWVAYFDVSEFLSHTWSLAVEEHYYLLWPLLLIRLLRLPRHHWPLALGGLYLLCVAVRIASAYDVSFHETYHASHNRLSALILGSAAAMLGVQRVRPAVVVLAAFLSVMIVMPGIFRWGARSTLTIGLTLAEWCSLIAVLACARFPHALEMTRLAWLGKYTYGIYLWHFPIMVLMSSQSYGSMQIFVVGSIGSTVLAIVSYHSVEKRFLQKGAHLSRTPRAVEETDGSQQALHREQQ